MNKQRQGASVIKGRIHNPASKAKWTLGLPGERNAMQKKKSQKKRGKGGRRNTAAAKTNKPKVNPSQATRATTSKPKVNGRRKKKYSRSRRNTFTFRGLNAMDLGVGALALIGTQAVAQGVRRWVDPSSYLGLGLQLGMAAGLYAICPSSMRNAVVLGAGITPVANAINRLTGNVIGTTIENAVQQVLPASTPTQQNGNGMSGLVNPKPGYILYRNG